MGKSLRTFPVSYTSLYLRRSRTGRGFELPTDRASESSRTSAPGPIASNSSSHPGQGEIGEPSPSLRVAPGILSNTTRDHPTSMPRSDRRCEEKHEPHHYQNGGERFLNGRFSSHHHPFLLYLMARGG